MATLILLRHGQSEWNAKNLFTGWVDVALTAQGEHEAREAGTLLRDEDLLPDILHTSLLSRAIITAHLALEQCDRVWIPENKSWRLNERHYGALQGLNKSESVDKYGEQQVLAWRRGYDTPPPLFDDAAFEAMYRDARYDGIDRQKLPHSECLADVVARTIPYYQHHIIPDLRKVSTVLVAAHGNSLRAIVKHLEGISDQDIVGLEMPTGVPRVYEMDFNNTGDVEIRTMRELGDPDAIAAARHATANQTHQH